MVLSILVAMQDTAQSEKIMLWCLILVVKTRFVIVCDKPGKMLYESSNILPPTPSEPVIQYYCSTDILTLPGNPDISNPSLTSRSPEITPTISNTPIPIRTTLPISPSAPIMALLLRRFARRGCRRCSRWRR